MSLKDNIVQVTGVIEDVKFKKGEKTTYKIYCSGINKRFDLYDGGIFFPVRKGDTINGYCSLKNNQLRLLVAPFVQPATDKSNVLLCMVKALKCSYKDCEKIYNKIKSVAGNEERVVFQLSSMAQTWNDNKNNEILFEVPGVEHEKMRKLLYWWYKERNLRRLYLLGLNKSEINASRMTCDKIYQTCIEDPYKIPAIPLDKCENIIDIIGADTNNNKKLCGSIIRVLWNNCIKRGWSATPIKFIKSQFNNIDKVETLLKDCYKVCEAFDCYYLEFPHKVERFLNKFLTEKVKKDPFTYDTICDEIIQGKDGKMIERLSAHFTKDLSENQKKAVQGAIDHNICVITGAAGTGKCLGINTKILMFDGRIKKVQNIKVGDKLMGPNSEPRNVLSLARGTDNMYKVKIKGGNDFICNQAHILTLKPIVKKYKIGGNSYNTYFLNSVKYLTQNVVDETSLDLIDISLSDYLNEIQQDDDFRKCHKLCVAPIEFPFKEVNVDPYEMGKQVARNNENIPETYKINSSKIRKAFLDGYRSELSLENEFIITITKENKNIVEDIRYIASTLGFGSSIIGNMLQVSKFEGDFDVEYQKIDNYYGFEIDADGRFLLFDCLVTHNTTCIDQIVHNLDCRGISYALCSFTGKAVSRLREVTKNKKASTIHRLIANSKKNGYDRRKIDFEKENNQGVVSHIIIDEASMVTSSLLYDLLRAYPDCEKITFVGDVNQLQPIEWGSFFAQVIKSETVPIYKLSTNYRVYTDTGEEDGVILNANNIIKYNKNSPFPFSFIPTTNFNLMEGPVDSVYDIIVACHDMEIDPSQLVIITPFNALLEPINKKFQQIYDNSEKRITDSRKITWRINDRVMMTENDNEIGVYNGEYGTVCEIQDDTILVNFGAAGTHEFLLEPIFKNRPNYPSSTYSQYYYQNKNCEDVVDGDEGDFSRERTVKKLIHGYCITVDKSQGSEWDYVVFFVPENYNSSFLNKNRIYTAITRTKRCCWCVVPNIESFEICATQNPRFRCENLSKHLECNLEKIGVCQDKIVSNLPEMFSEIPEDYFEFDPDFDDDY